MKPYYEDEAQVEAFVKPKAKPDAASRRRRRAELLEERGLKLAEAKRGRSPVATVVSLSGGRDSGAVGVWIAREFAAGRISGPLHYVSADVGPRQEPHLRPWLDLYRAKVLDPLSIPLHVVAHRDARGGVQDGWDVEFDNPHRRRPILPGPLNRSCTDKLKLRPMRAWRKSLFAEGDPVLWVIGYRRDEGNQDRVVGGEFDTDRVTGDPIWRPFLKLGWGLDKVRSLLVEAGVPEPDMYQYAARSGCAFCFFKPRHVLRRAADALPELYEHACQHEERVIATSGGKRGASPYVITKDGTLRELVEADRAQLAMPEMDGWDDSTCGDQYQTCKL